MATPVNDSYSVANGVTMYCGRSAPSAGLPAWRTAITAGKFADISTNTLYSVRPSGWPSTELGGPLMNWCGAFVAKDFSTLGAYGVYGSGHQSTDDPLWAGTWLFDLDTLAWTGRNVPPAPLLQDPIGGLYRYDPDYYTSLSPLPVGYTYPTHTYTSMTVRPPSAGGGTKGSLMALGIGGGGAYNMLNKFDLSSTTAPSTRPIGVVTMGGGASGGTRGTYTATARDDARGGIWALSYDGSGPLVFIADNDTVTSYPAVGFSVYGDQTIVLLPAPWDCLVFIGHDISAGAITTLRVSKFISNVPQAITTVTMTGTPCPEARCGGDWCPPLGAIVSYAGGGSYDVYKLTPPSAANVTTGTWTWTKETLSGMTGQAPSNPGTNPNSGLPYTNNGTWSKFKYVASVNAFLWCGGVQAPTQAFVLTGM